MNRRRMATWENERGRHPGRGPSSEIFRLGGEPARLALDESGFAGGSGLGLQRVLGLFDQGVESHFVLNRNI
jgi:hypothetical protein